jgi:hypothetical protein
MYSMFTTQGGLVDELVEVLNLPSGVPFLLTRQDLTETRFIDGHPGAAGQDGNGKHQGQLDEQRRRSVGTVWSGLAPIGVGEWLTQ